MVLKSVHLVMLHIASLKVIYMELPTVGGGNAICSWGLQPGTGKFTYFYGSGQIPEPCS